MQIHRILGSTLKEALLRARRMFGEDAIVVSQEVLPGGEFALAVAQRGEGAEILETTLSRTQRGQRQEPPALRELAQRLARHGASAEFAARILQGVRARLAPERHVFDLAAEEIAKLVSPVRLGRVSGKTRVLAFAGATGVGKTTTLVKLAKKMRDAGRRVELATLDSHRVGAVEQLRAWSNALSLPLTVLKRGVRMNPEALASGGVDLVLLDTTGHPKRDAELLGQLATVFVGAPVLLDLQLVFAAPASRAALETAWKPFEALRPSACCITKLDETEEKTMVLEFGLEKRLSPAFLCDGPDLDAGFHRATGDACADLLLRGRLA